MKPKTTKPKTKITRRGNPSATPKARMRAAQLWRDIPKTDREDMVTGLLQECGIPRRRLLQLLPDPSAEEIAEARTIKDRAEKARGEYERNPAAKSEREEQLRKAKDALRKARAVAPDDPRTKLLDFIVRALAAEVRAMRPKRCIVPCPPDRVEVIDTERVGKRPTEAATGGALFLAVQARDISLAAKNAKPAKVKASAPRPASGIRKQIGTDAKPEKQSKAISAVEAEKLRSDIDAAPHVRVDSAERDLNSRMNGSEMFRKFNYQDGRSFAWGDERLPAIGIRAWERRTSTQQKVPVGTVVQQFDRSVSGGRRAKCSRTYWIVTRNEKGTADLVELKHRTLRSTDADEVTLPSGKTIQVATSS